MGHKMATKTDFSEECGNGRTCAAKSGEDRKACEWYVPRVNDGKEQCRHIVLGKLCFATPEGIAKRRELGRRFNEMFLEASEVQNAEKRPQQRSGEKSERGADETRRG